MYLYFLYLCTQIARNKMKFPQPYTLEQIATIIGSRYIGDKDFPVLGMNEIHVVREGDIVFVDHPKSLTRRYLALREKPYLFPRILFVISISSPASLGLLRKQPPL